MEEYKKHEHLNLPQVYQNNLKLDSLRNFYDKYQFKKPEVADTLYNSEYLKTVKPELKPVFEEIKSKYGTDVITSNVSTTKEDAEYVKYWENADINSMSELNRLTDAELKTYIKLEKKMGLR